MSRGSRFSSCVTFLSRVSCVSVSVLPQRVRLNTNLDGPTPLNPKRSSHRNFHETSWKLPRTDRVGKVPGPAARLGTPAAKKSRRRSRRISKTVRADLPRCPSGPSSRRGPPGRPPGTDRSRMKTACGPGLRAQNAVRRLGGPLDRSAASDQTMLHAPPVAPTSADDPSQHARPSRNASSAPPGVHSGVGRWASTGGKTRALSFATGLTYTRGRCTTLYQGL